VLRFVGECNSCFSRQGYATSIFLKTDSKDEAWSLRADLDKLILAEGDPRAAVYNAALRDVRAILDRYEIERQKNARRAILQRKDEGKKIGGDVPYGYKIAADGELLIKSPSEQQVIIEARKMKAAGYSLREIGKRLIANGLFPREGKKFHAAQIKRLTDGRALEMPVASKLRVLP